MFNLLRNPRKDYYSQDNCGLQSRSRLAHRTQAEQRVAGEAHWDWSEKSRIAAASLTSTFLCIRSVLTLFFSSVTKGIKCQHFQLGISTSKDTPSSTLVRNGIKRSYLARRSPRKRHFQGSAGSPAVPALLSRLPTFPPQSSASLAFKETKQAVRTVGLGGSEQPHKPKVCLLELAAPRTDPPPTPTWVFEGRSAQVFGVYASEACSKNSFRASSGSIGWNFFFFFLRSAKFLSWSLRVLTSPSPRFPSAQSERRDTTRHEPAHKEVKCQVCSNLLFRITWGLLPQ